MERKLETRITRMLGIERPILLGAMQWLAKAELVAAVSNAGGLGVMSSATFPNAEELRQEIRKCRTLTDKPFAVNLTLMPSLAPPDYPSYVRVCIEENIRIMETSGRAPEPFMEAMKGAGMIVIHKCTAVRHAKTAQKIGCDAVIMDGTEAAGHVGENDVGSIALWPAAVDALDIPVIACGGVGDGRGLAAALMLGCDGATVGTRFFLSDSGSAPLREHDPRSEQRPCGEGQTDGTRRRFHRGTCSLYLRPTPEDRLRNRKPQRRYPHHRPDQRHPA